MHRVRDGYLSAEIELQEYLLAPILVCILYFLHAFKTVLTNLDAGAVLSLQ